MKPNKLFLLIYFASFGQMFAASAPRLIPPIEGSAGKQEQVSVVRSRAEHLCQPIEARQPFSLRMLQWWLTCNRRAGYYIHSAQQALRTALGLWWLGQPAWGAVPISFLKTWSQGWDVYSHAMIQSSDGGFVITGQGSSNGTKWDELLLAKFTADGELDWARAAANGRASAGWSVTETKDQGLVVTGETTGFFSTAKELLLAKFTFDGHLIWATSLSGGGYDHGASVVQTLDGGLMVTGYTGPQEGKEYDLLLARFTKHGVLEWVKVMAGERDDRGLSIAVSEEGGVVVAGSTRSYKGKFCKALLAKFSANGTLSWAKAFGKSTSYNEARSVLPSSDNGFIVTGETMSYTQARGNLLLAKFNSNGQLDWAKGLTRRHYNYYGNSVIQTKDSGWVVGGLIYGRGKGLNDVLLAKFTTNGGVDWVKTLQGALSDSGAAVQQTKDGLLVMTGSTQSYGLGVHGFLLATSDDDSSLDCATAQTGLSSVDVSLEEFDITPIIHIPVWNGMPLNLCIRDVKLHSTERCNMGKWQEGATTQKADNQGKTEM